ncbi:hypothetical protein VBApiPXC38_83 [Acinetobacter phage VB_ApiP_XC38]|uniref:Uncharacterized protein n=1 Tax=Acinetobacter phage VB_ApiP_XC38 TaxID=2655002 RepID=A0A5P8PR53_9CAUD|nr:hypothetical protein KNU81_gp83 [Acinetobacter phage VB_ApiP_XC38]QFR59770.1 hypothetical protein VBApiPXC38_83 [Acinetobacter phage VB_ApiP_XC38]
MQSAKEVPQDNLKNQSVNWLLNNFRGIYITHACANNLITQGAEEHHMMRIFLRDTSEYVIFIFLPTANVVLATSASAIPDTDDDTALAVSLIPTLEAREVYLNEL